MGVYQHSGVARDLLVRVLEGLGAEVTPLARSETFIPVDTEAIRAEDIELGRQWAAEQSFDAIVSTDGDADRPLIADERGEWLRGDVVGPLCAHFLAIDTLVTPVSSNTVVEACGWFRSVYRTRIGSPYVIEEMEQELAAGQGSVAGYEANGGFLLASDISLKRKNFDSPADARCHIADTRSAGQCPAAGLPGERAGRGAARPLYRQRPAEKLPHGDCAAEDRRTRRVRRGNRDHVRAAMRHGASGRPNRRLENYL